MDFDDGVSASRTRVPVLCRCGTHAHCFCSVGACSVGACPNAYLRCQVALGGAKGGYMLGSQSGYLRWKVIRIYVSYREGQAPTQQCMRYKAGVCWVMEDGRRAGSGAGVRGRPCVIWSRVCFREFSLFVCGVARWQTVFDKEQVVVILQNVVEEILKDQPYDHSKVLFSVCSVQTTPLSLLSLSLP
jgi:hypothetical protein